MLKKTAIITLLFLSPVYIWLLYKPVRALMPESHGMICIHQLCMDDHARFNKANDIYQASLALLTQRGLVLDPNYRVVMCSTESCDQRFGIRSSEAIHFPGHIILGSRAWTARQLAYQLVYEIQTQRLGFSATWLKPTWFIEGMADVVSSDPDSPVQRTEEEEMYRTEFIRWLREVTPSRLWQGANTL